ncbi:type II toxin-antitoxin system HicB family antitoxin [Candidatus Poriferisodalis sp.]|uniref:type II toxin-antitoxin system HicB family antitoxin n=1 Tax=Candidatus Poriferisodalis sp. TaxID=3101277 RepID=UPI003B013657
MRYVYPCIIERDEEEAAATGRTCYLAVFPDVHAAHTGGWSVQEVNDNLRDCLETALSFCIDSNEPLPEPSEPEPGQLLVAVSPPVAAQFALHDAMLAANVTAAEMARRIGMRPSHARRITDIFKPAKPDQIERALAAVGLQMVSEASPLDQWAPTPDPAPALESTHTARKSGPAH